MRTQMRAFRKWVTQRSFVVNEEADGFRLQLVHIEAGGEADLHGQFRMLS